MFDEQPDGDPHGECAAEIHRLALLVAELRAALTDLLSLSDITQPMPDIVPGIVSRAREALASSAEQEQKP